MTLIATSLNRRSFLKASTLAGGGLMIGFSWLASCNPTEEEIARAPKSWFDINAYLKIADNGQVTIYSPNPEIGQNVKTSMPMIVAEELGVNWKDVIVEQAPLNTVKYSHQIAGGSQSIRQGWDGLRMAGATARHMLLTAAAHEWQADIGDLTTADGMIRMGNKSMSYGEAAAKVGNLEVPDEVEVKDPKDFKLIGTPTRNVDGKKIVTGQPLFGLDTRREGMLIAMIVHPPAFGMKFGSMNAEKAKGMPGIHDVFTITTKVPEEGRQWSDVNAFTELVVVAGNSTWEVMEAKKALTINWVKDSDVESTTGHKSSFDQLLASGNGEEARRDGDPEKAFREADKIVEKTYYAPFLAHNTMEPMNFFADVRNGKAELLGPVQTPENLSKSVSAILNIPVENISVMMTRMGGGFGRRLYGNFGVEAAVISDKLQAPVKLVYSREDDMTQGTYRPSYQVTYRAALDQDGQLTAFHVKGVGIGESPLFPNRFPAGAVENYLAENYSLDSNISTGAWRAPRSNFIGGAEQAFMDELAEAAGKDPIAFRLELFDKSIDGPVGENNDYEAQRYAGVLKLVRDKSGWGKEMPGVYRGVSAYFCHNSYVAQVVDVVMKNNRPEIQKVWCAVDCGIVVNPEGARNQVEGGITDGIGHAMYSAMTFQDGKPGQQNFDRYRLIRNTEAPKDIEIFFTDNGIHPTGLGEPGLPPASAALANALAKATGTRLYTQPFISQSILRG